MRATTITTTGLALCALFGLGLPAFAEEPAEDAAPEGPALNYQTGNITLPNKVATLHLAGNYRYLDPAETEKLLVAWGNEPGNDTQGAIVPNDVDPLTGEGWAVIVTYEEDGHIDDSDAKDIDYDDMLKDMKEGTEDNNKARKEAGYEAVHLIGWAESRTTIRPPRSSTGPRSSSSKARTTTRSTTTCACSAAKACCR